MPKEFDDGNARGGDAKIGADGFDTLSEVGGLWDDLEWKEAVGTLKKKRHDAYRASFGVIRDNRFKGELLEGLGGDRFGSAEGRKGRILDE